MSYLYIII